MQEKCNYGSNKKNVDQGTFELVQYDGEKLDFLFSSQNIGTDLCQTFLCLIFGKPCF